MGQGLFNLPPTKSLCKETLSDKVVLKTRALQGCVLSLSLFSVYSNEITLQDSNLSYSNTLMTWL